MNHKLWDLNNKTRWCLVPTIANNRPFWQFRNVLQLFSFKSLFLGLKWWYKYEIMLKRKLGISSTQRYMIHGYTKKKCWFSSVFLSGTWDKKTRRDFSPRKQASCALATLTAIALESFFIQMQPLITAAWAKLEV